MKIVDIKTAVVKYHGRATLIRIDTDEGLSGYGEANPDAGAAAIVGLVSELRNERVGEDPRNVEHCCEKLRRRHVFSGAQSGDFRIALSGIEIALWDLAAKAAGQPLYRLMEGKFRDGIRVYADCGDGDDQSGWPEGCAAGARRMAKEGFAALRFDVGNLDHPARFDRANTTANAAEIGIMVERVVDAVFRIRRVQGRQGPRAGGCGGRISGLSALAYNR